MSRQRHRRQLSPADRHTLLCLMSDEHYQQTKLGAALSPDRQRRSSLFWRMAAAYLEQPVLRVMLAGSSLRAGADCWVIRWAARWLGAVPAELPLAGSSRYQSNTGFSSCFPFAEADALWRQQRQRQRLQRRVWQPLPRGRDPRQQLHKPHPQQQSRRCRPQLCGTRSL